MSGPDRQPTLLQDLETLHRNLKELESVKSYVQVIHRALYLRCDYLNNFRVLQLTYPGGVGGHPSEAAIRQAHDFASHASVSDYGLLHTFVSQVVDKCTVADH